MGEQFDRKHLRRWLFGMIKAGAIFLNRYGYPIGHKFVCRCRYCNAARRKEKQNGKS